MEKAQEPRRWLRKIGVAGFFFFLVKGLLWVALALLASEILPRVGYAKVDVAQPPVWLCRD